MQTGNSAVYSVRRAIAGSSCMVSSGHHLATLAGAEVLREGGNAIDAAIAAGAVASVVLPHACGLGGDAFDALVREGKLGDIAWRASLDSGVPSNSLTVTTMPSLRKSAGSPIRSRGI